MARSVGVVLSGGGARGAAHLGFLKALDELKIKVSAISGVSAGAVIGALYAAALSPDTILVELTKLSYFSIKDFSWLKDGLFTMTGLRKKLDELIGKDDFSGLAIPLYVNATDIVSGTCITFSAGPLYDAIIGSASVPVIYEPVAYGNYRLLDGGMLNNFPVEPLCKDCDAIIGSHVNKIYNGSFPEGYDKTALIDRCFHLVIDKSVQERTLKCDVFVEPLLKGYSMFGMKNADKIFEIGYTATMKQKEQLKVFSTE